MLKVVLRYTDCLQDGRNVFRILADNNAKILKTRKGFSIHPKITIVVKDYNELNLLISELNCNCSYEVRVVKTKIMNSQEYIKTILPTLREKRKENKQC